MHESNLEAEELARLRREAIPIEGPTPLSHMGYVAERVRQAASSTHVGRDAAPELLGVVEEILGQQVDLAHPCACKVTRIAAALSDLGRSVWREEPSGPRYGEDHAEDHAELRREIWALRKWIEGRCSVKNLHLERYLKEYDEQIENG